MKAKYAPREGGVETTKYELVGRPKEMKYVIWEAIFRMLTLLAAFLGIYYNYQIWYADFQHSKERDYKMAMFQHKLRLYEDLTSTAARMAKANSAEKWHTHRETFWALHYGPVRMVGNKELTNKLKEFGETIKVMNDFINRSSGPVKTLPAFHEEVGLYQDLSRLAKEISDLCKDDLDSARTEIKFETGKKRQDAKKTESGTKSPLAIPDSANSPSNNSVNSPLDNAKKIAE